MNTRLARRFGAVLAASAMMALPAAAQAASVAPTTATGNPGCADLNPGWSEFKIDRVPRNQTYTDGAFSVVISNVQDQQTFDWSANQGVDAVLVKGSTDTNVYTYNPEASSDTGMDSPGTSAISHVSFCYDAGSPPPPPTCEEQHAGEADSDGDGIVDACDETPLPPAGEQQGADATSEAGATAAGEQQAAGEPGEIAVLGERVSSATARMVAAEGCAARAFRARVRGTQIASVVFVLDGKRIATVTKPNRAGVYSIRVNPARLGLGVHRLVATVRFKSSARTAPKTLRAAFQRCGRQLVAPRFTG